MWENIQRRRRDDSEIDREREKEYKRLNNQVRHLIRNAVKNVEKNIAKHVKDNPKIFWKYVSSKTRTKSRIGDLYKNGENDTARTDKEKADVLLEQFASVFITEPEGESPPAMTRNIPRMNNVEITTNKIREIIKKLRGIKLRDRMVFTPE